MPISRGALNVVGGIVVGVVAIGVIAATKKDVPKKDASQAPAPAPGPPEELGSAAVEAKAAQLYTDYQKNEVGADAKYRGKVVRVVGIVDRVAKDIAGDALVRLQAPAKNYIQARFTDESQLIPLEPYDIITIRCVGDGWSLGVPVLKRCVLEDRNGSDPSAPAPK